MAVTRAHLLRVLWTLVDPSAGPETEVRVSPASLAAALECSREEAGQALTDLGAGWLKTREAGGKRVRWRTVQVASLGSRPRAPAAAPPAPPVGRPLAESPPANGPHVDVACRRCGTGLPEYMQYLGLCGNCLLDAQQAVSRVPGPRYGCVQEAQAQHAEPLWSGAMRQVGYGGR